MRLDDIPTDKEKSAAYAKARWARLMRAKKKGRHTTAQWMALVAEFKGCCVRCGLDCKYDVQKDHIVAIYYDDSTDLINNIQPLCIHCNSTKGPEDINWVWFRRRFGFSKTYTLKPGSLKPNPASGTGSSHDASSIRQAQN